MIHYNRFVLDNGLRVLVHEDFSTPLAVVNVMYDVGARDENPLKTGFAHLFEHLMFGGSIHIPDYDEPLQKAGGENNAYTTNDLTNYYCQLPAQNIETAFWLESDRMLSLDFNEKSLAVQRKVVCEEFKEHYLNKPYGDAWHQLRNLAYNTHPYRWQTIGMELAHVENATLDDVKAFFYKHYTPVNAILVVSGPVKTEEIKALAAKWFEPIPAGEKYTRQLSPEPDQTASRYATCSADVPLDALYTCYHIDSRLERGYYLADLLSEILGGGGSSRLYQNLVKEKQVFTGIDCYHFGSIDPGLLAIEGKVSKGVTLESAQEAIDEQIHLLLNGEIRETELQKIKNKTESVIAFEDIGLMNRSNSLAFYELLGNADLMNEELGRYQSVTADELIAYGKKVLMPDNRSTLFYRRN
jgi:predicted Zn-dependent peptidase